MTLKIEVTVPQDIIEAQGAGLYLGHALSAIGYKRIAEGTTLAAALAERDAEREVSDEMSERACEDEAREAAKERMAEQVQEVVAKRKRRTKAEIEADNAASAAQAQPEPEQPNISTGAERIDPANPEDAAQDAADEAAEAEKVKAAAGGKLTHDDLRKAVSRYQVAFGMADAIAMVPKILGCAISEVPEADLASAIAKIDAAVSASKAETAAAPAEAVTPAREFTKQTVVAALKAYGAKYDGETNDTSKMPSTMEDCPRIFEELFGAGAVSVSKIPQTPEAFEKATLAIEAAVESNRFGRTAVAQ